jgi:hypothetical protein
MSNGWLPDGVGQKTTTLRHVFLGASEVMAA